MSTFCSILACLASAPTPADDDDDDDDSSGNDAVSCVDSYDLTHSSSPCLAQRLDCYLAERPLPVLGQMDVCLAVLPALVPDPTERSERGLLLQAFDLPGGLGG